MLCNVCLLSDNNDGTRRAIGALSQALKSQKQVALCRLVKRANADPWLVVLLPNPDGTLLMHRLPCSEDIRNFLFPPLTSMSDVSSLQQQSVGMLITFLLVLFCLIFLSSCLLKLLLLTV